MAAAEKRRGESPAPSAGDAGFVASLRTKGRDLPRHLREATQHFQDILLQTEAKPDTNHEKRPHHWQNKKRPLTLAGFVRGLQST
ncbi:hypothetical protein PsYK624_073900 [Phanerochaete sordida]|uniref:Uncharacterized protein n=1 Tax=Phanerochaete sordida TaxID=48140 RepID=A0A9P3LD75_9APHY|nr:hypothetical protein PsYK624_073900 [Phanerochaete sordida]